MNPNFQVTSGPMTPACLSPGKFFDVEVTFTPISELEVVSQIRVTHTNSDNVGTFTKVIIRAKGGMSAGGAGLQ